MRELLYPFADRYFFNGVIAGTMLTLVILVLILFLVGRWSLPNLFAIFCFVVLFIIALKESANMYKVKK